MGAANFMSRIYEIYSEGVHTKCSWKILSCSQACVLRTASTQPEMLKHLQRLNFLPKLCIVHEMCPATAWSALILLDNLMQRVEVASLLFTMLPKAESFNCALHYQKWTLQRNASVILNSNNACNPSSSTCREKSPRIQCCLSSHSLRFPKSWSVKLSPRLIICIMHCCFK